MNGNNNGLEALAAAANNSENQTRHNEAPVAAASGRDNQQQWQHALSTLGLSGLAPQPAAPAPASLDGSTIMQQLAQRYYMQEVQAKIRQAQDGQNLQALQALFGQHVLGGQSQVLPPPAAAAAGPSSSTNTSASMPPPSGTVSSLSTLSTAGISGRSSPCSGGGSKHTAIAPLPGDDVCSMGGLSDGVKDNKKQIKRAANRRSAQLSRKRKKQFIEELKEENDDLRRKEMILKSIPDLIVVFDSAGKLWFVSESISRFLSYTAEEMEGTSFWERLCVESVRLLKSAFMDSLAARTEGSDTAPLGSGIWELRLVDKDGTHKVVALNGVVHFSGDRPECVCSIRPRDELAETEEPEEKKQKSAAEEFSSKNNDVAAVSVSTGSDPASSSMTSDNKNYAVTKKPAKTGFQPLIRAKPYQSVISNGNTSSASGSRSGSDVRLKVKGKRRDAARISDGDSGSADSGSSDELGE